MENKIRSSSLVRKMLQDEGFVHVTGLPYSTLGPQKHGRRIIGARQSDLGHWSFDYSCVVAVTPEGEVWCMFLKEAERALPLDVLREASPKGTKEALLLTSGQRFDSKLLDARRQNPDDTFGGRYPINLTILH